MVENGFDLTSEELYKLLESVYSTTDFFVNDFDREYSSVQALDERIDGIRKRPGSLLLAAREKGRLQGYALVVPRTAVKLLHTADLTMGVCRDVRGRGLGAELLQAVLSELEKTRVIEIVYLMVRTDNAAAIRLYERFGFQSLAILPCDIKIADAYYDGLLMRRQIP